MQHLNYYVAEIFVIGGIASAAIIAADMRTCRQGMRIMNWVWILTGLWANFFGLWAYFAFGRTRQCFIDEQAFTHKDRGRQPEKAMDGMPGMKMSQMSGMRTGEPMEVRPRWQSVVLSTLHCGAGCTLADISGEWLMQWWPLAIGGSLVAGAWAVDYVLALLFGIGFQYAAIRAMDRTLPGKQVLRNAAKADILSLTAWQVGMFAWMAVVIFGLNEGAIPDRTSFYFWFMMQIAMGFGFVVSLPVNGWLIRHGVKHGM